MEEIKNIDNIDNNDNNTTDKKRKYVFIVSRIYPGEPNSSFMTEGAIEYLISDDLISQHLKQKFIF